MLGLYVFTLFHKMKARLGVRAPYLLSSISLLKSTIWARRNMAW